MRSRTLSLVLLFLPSLLFALSPKYKEWAASPQAYFMTKAERAQWAGVVTDADAEKFINDFVASRGPGFADMVTDRVTNEGFQPTPFMLLYHVNAGYPVLDAESRLYLNATSTIPVTEIAAQGQADWDKGAPPQAGWSEHVYYHQVQPRADGFATAALVNPSVAGGIVLTVSGPTSSSTYRTSR